MLLVLIKLRNLLLQQSCAVTGPLARSQLEIRKLIHLWTSIGKLLFPSGAIISCLPCACIEDPLSLNPLLEKELSDIVLRVFNSQYCVGLKLTTSFD